MRLLRFCDRGGPRIAAAAVATAVALVLSSTAGLTEPNIGDASPPLAVTELDGRSFDLNNLRGKVVLVNFWASWCAPCRKEMPRLNAYYRSHRDKGLAVIGISIDRPQDFTKARGMAAALSYPAALANDNKLTEFGVPEAVPVTYVIDSSGVVRDKFIDVYDRLLKDVVDPLLGH